jgi:arsenate reductase
MAEAFLKKIGGDVFEVESAGLEPGKLNPFAIKVMNEEGIDISQNRTKDVFNLLKSGKHFNYVVTVCDANNAEKCPLFPGVNKKIAWDFEDPSVFKGSDEEKLNRTRKVKDEIKYAVENFIRRLE